MHKRRLIPHLDAMYLGTAKLGARGQVVIPAEARRALKLQSGDKLMVFVKSRQAIGLMKVEALSAFVDRLSRELGNLKRR